MKKLILIFIMFLINTNITNAEDKTIEIEGKEIKVTECKSFFSKFRGLMFSPKKNLLFEFSQPSKPTIHMFFVFYPIEIYYLDENMNILDKVMAKPFGIYRTKFKCKYVLEVAKDKNYDEL